MAHKWILEWKKEGNAFLEITHYQSFDEESLGIVQAAAFLFVLISCIFP